MKSPSEILNIPVIQEEIHKKHQNFLKEYGGAIEKVMADHKLFADIALAKLHRILIIFKEEKVIDEIQIHEKGPYKYVLLYKTGCDTYINLETNGIVIAIQGYTYQGNDFNSDFGHNKKIIKGVNESDFDWANFSDQLLDYIHGTIYERKEVIEQKIKGIFKDNIPKDEIINNTTHKINRTTEK